MAWRLGLARWLGPYCLASWLGLGLGMAWLGLARLGLAHRVVGLELWLGLASRLGLACRLVGRTPGLVGLALAYGRMVGMAELGVAPC